MCFLHFLLLLLAQTPKHHDLDCGTSWLCVRFVQDAHTSRTPSHAQICFQLQVKNIPNYGNMKALQVLFRYCALISVSQICW